MSDPFDRTRRLIARLGGGEAAIATMASLRVELFMPEPTPADEIALALAATLLLRLDRAAPTLSIRTPATRQRSIPLLGDGRIVDEIATAHEGFASVERLTADPFSDPDLRVVFGAADLPGLSVRSSGWSAVLGIGVQSCPAGNALGASLAGVLSSIEVLKAAFLKAHIATGLVRPWSGSVSLWSYDARINTGPVIDAPLDLDDTAIIGAGGIGSPLGWVLSLLDRTGAPTVIDKDVVDSTSLNRHLTAGFAEVGQSKAALLATLLESDQCSPKVRQSRWQALPESERSPRVAIVTVDNDPTRRDVQLDMPRWVLNAGTSDDGLYRVSRHDFLTGACTCCLSHADERSAGLLDSIASRLGLDPGALEPYLHRPDPLPAEILDKADLDQADRLALAAVPGTALAETVCATVQAKPEDPAVSAPMLSAAPAVLLAADLARLHMEPAGFSASDTSTSIFTGPHRAWTRTRSKRTGCPCTNAFYTGHYRRKWVTA